MARTNPMEKTPSGGRIVRGGVLLRLLVALPLLAAALTAVAARRCWYGWGGCDAPPPGTGVERLGRLSRHEAAARGTELCARLTQGPCPVLTAVPFTVAPFAPPHDPNEPTDPTERLRPEWHVTCRAANGVCFLRFDAQTGQLRQFGNDRERDFTSPATAAGATAAPDPASHGDRSPALSQQEAEGLARRYLRLAGLDREESAARVRAEGHAFVFRLPGSGGSSRLVQVHLSPYGSLALLYVRQERPH
jgi:hypothetical protein